MRRVLANGLLAAVSVVLCLVVAEAATRWIDGHSLWGLRPPEANVSIGLDTTPQHLDSVPRAGGVDRAWFDSPPPPLPNRGQRSPWTEGAEAANAAAPADLRTDFRSTDFFKAWNAAFVGDPCASPFFRGAPGRLIVFDPPAGERRPIYRYLPSTTTPLGLVTNQLGFRGPPVDYKRRPDTVRIVLIGASTTAEAHATAYSGSEMLNYWLNLWATANHPGLKLEVINAGREAVKSPDIEAIVRQEVLPLRPDLVLYYEGANQFDLAPLVKDLPARRTDDRQDWNDIVAGWLKEASNWSALARRARALFGLAEVTEGGGEPAKPDYTLVWPRGVDEADPNLASPDLPVNLPVILGDLDRMRKELAAAGSEFAVASFMWLARDGMVVNPVRNRLIYDYLNVSYYPFRYRDIARLAAFQNRVFAKYAATRGVPFIDVVRYMPFDPDLFADAIHNTQPGINLRAWIVLQQLVPIIEARLASGTWPRSPPPAQPATPPIFAGEPRLITFDCALPPPVASPGEAKDPRG
jgi:hypothetical protein